MQPGDVPITYADTTALEEDFGFKPSTSLRDGLRKFAEWYKEFYIINFFLIISKLLFSTPSIENLLTTLFIVSALQYIFNVSAK